MKDEMKTLLKLKRFDASYSTGDNILGFALMEVREKLKEADE